MGGQACVFYGAAEFSRDLDLLLLADDANLTYLREALASLDAESIAVPELAADSLNRGLAAHFRCHREDVAGLRIDVMAALRGVAGFDELWSRRTTIEVDGEAVDMLSVDDLVRSKKTQRDKDWPMIRRLVERNFFDGGDDPARVVFWLRELRTPELLVGLVKDQPAAASALAPERPAVRIAQGGDVEQVATALMHEELDERRQDRAYWAPLKQELEQLRRSRRDSAGRNET